MQTEYDLAERPMQSTLRDEEGNVLYRATLTYDAQNRLQTFHERTGDTYHKTAFTYDKDSRVTQMDYDTDKGKVEYTYDTLGRVSSRKVTNGETAYETAYTFVKGADAYGGNATTPLIASIRQGEGDSAMNFAYEYDSRGNITSETRNGKVTTYTYDALGQLIRVNDPNDPAAGEGGTTWLYEYDRGGNILTKSCHRYTTGTLGVAHDTILYSYTDSNWKDKLTAYDGQTITYDAIGNPLNDGRRRYEWQAGRQLKKVYIKADLKEGTKPGVDEQSGTVLKIAWSNGNLLEGSVSSTQASAEVTRCGEDVTEEYAASAFAWKRDSGNAGADATWNAAHVGMKTISLTEADLNGGNSNVKITCTLTASGATYGTITVDGNMDAHHTPAGLDANDVFVIEDGHLKVTTSRGNVYALEDGEVKGAGAKLNGSITAQSKLFASQPEDMVEFSYDHNGLRTQKKVTKADGEIKTSEYIFRNKLLTHLACEGKMVHFFYDKFKKPLFIELNGELFTYVYNLQGDVISIIDSVGTTVVSYKYDAWGGLLMTTKLSKQYDDLIELNPFRYRSYMFDDESKLYYLKTRFYDFEKGRMISADTVLGQRKVSNPHNVFAYCKSNPCMRVDYDGKFDFITYGDCGIPYDFYMRVFTKVRRAKEILDELETAFTKTTNKSFKQLLYETMPVASIKDIEFTKTEVYNNEMYGVLKTLSNLNTIGVPSVVSDALQSNPITFGAGPMAEIVMTLVGGFSEQIIVNNQYLAPELQMDTGTHNIYELHLTLQAPQAHTTIAMWYTFHEGEFFDGVDLTVMEMYDDGLQQDTIINNYTYTCN